MKARIEMDKRNQYLNTEIRWIIAQRIKGQEWEIKRLGSGELMPTLDKVLDVTPQYIIAESEFGVFKNRENWWEYLPRLYYRGYNDAPIRASVGAFVNARESDWF